MFQDDDQVKHQQVEKVKNFEKQRGKPLRDYFPRVIKRDDYVFKKMNNKQLPTPLDDENEEVDVLTNMFDFNRS